MEYSRLQMNTNAILVVLVLTAILFLWLAWRHNRQKTVSRCDLDLDCHWHVPLDALEDFGLSAFVLSRDYLFIENDTAGVVFDGPVTCKVDRKGDCQQLLIPDGPSFMRRVTI